MEKWKTMPTEMPTDGYSCFVRLNYWFGAPFRAYYTSATKEWTSEDNALKYPVWAVCRWKYDDENFYATISQTGLGTGVSTLRMTVSENQTLELTNGNARFYNDAAGTQNESTTWEITTGALRTIYLKANTGDTGLRFPKPDKVISWGDANQDGWTSGSNAAAISIRIAGLGLTQSLRITGNSTLTGAMPAITGTLYMEGNNINWIYSGALPAITETLWFSGNGIKWTYTGALPDITGSLMMSGTGINWTHTGALPAITGLLLMSGTGINWTHTGALPANTSTLWLNGNGIKWTYTGALTDRTGKLYMNGTGINWTGLSIGNGNLTTCSLNNYRDAKMTSADMLTLLAQMTNRTGTLPATVTINDYADYLNPPQTVIDAVALLKTTKNITTVNLGA